MIEDVVLLDAYSIDKLKQLIIEYSKFGYQITGNIQILDSNLTPRIFYVTMMKYKESIQNNS